MYNFSFLTEMTYLASPYSHDDPKVREARFWAVAKAASKLIKSGKLVFSPITHSHPIAVQGELPCGFDYWEEFDRRMICKCDYITVLMLDGWEDSVGISSEIRIAKQLGKPIYYMNPVAE